jgi:hypothetical protein
MESRFHSTSLERQNKSRAGLKKAAKRLSRVKSREVVQRDEQIGISCRR